jgi:hypothetical protein
MHAMGSSLHARERLRRAGAANSYAASSSIPAAGFARASKMGCRRAIFPEPSMPMSALATLSPAEHLAIDPPRALRFHRCQGVGELSGHDMQTRATVAEGLAQVLGYRFIADSTAHDLPTSGAYLVPSDTLCSFDEARRLGITGISDLFGGVVPFPFVATKLVTHGLVGAQSDAPPGWVHALGRELGNAVLPGYSVFDKDDAWQAGVRLLLQGSVRIKDAGGVGGSGQSVATTSREFAEQIDAIGAERLAKGFVIERNLTRVATCSVGQIRVGPWTASYAGKQRSTRNHRGDGVYGGSSLTVVKGGFDELMRLDLSPRIRLAVDQARRYHRAMHQAFDGMFASRCNYDVAQGNDAAGRWQSGVLEQSWRIGGCSGAEVAALQAFKDHGARVVRASTHEIYGQAVIPRSATVLFDGVDPKAGRLVKYAQVHTHVHA